MKTTLLALLISLLPVLPQGLPTPTPPAGAKQLIDNERVTVWDVTREKGMQIPRYRSVMDSVTVDLIAKGTATFTKIGDVQEAGVAPAASHTIVIDLKPFKMVPLENKTGYPEAFPRENSRKVLHNPRVNVWDFAWTPGKPSAMHFHSTDVVVIYLDNGELSSTTPDGKTTVNASTFGQVKFNARNRSHSELLVKGMQRVIAVELK